jgi:hypothetical protein
MLPASAFQCIGKKHIFNFIIALIEASILLDEGEQIQQSRTFGSRK